MTRTQFWIGVVLFVLATWLAWPMLTFQHFPHIGRREYAAQFVMVLAWVLVTTAHARREGK